jgi:hypothetical protein
VASSLQFLHGRQDMETWPSALPLRSSPGSLSLLRSAMLLFLWQVLGITDLVTAVTLGTTAQLLRPHDPSMLPMTVLPLSLIPTFLVPLFLILHTICIAQARSWKFASERTRPTTRAAQQSGI